MAGYDPNSRYRSMERQARNEFNTEQDRIDLRTRMRFQPLLFVGLLVIVLIIVGYFSLAH